MWHQAEEEGGGAVGVRVGVGERVLWGVRFVGSGGGGVSGFGGKICSVLFFLLLFFFILLLFNTFFIHCIHAPLFLFIQYACTYGLCTHTSIHTQHPPSLALEGGWRGLGGAKARHSWKIKSANINLSMALF